MIEKLVSGGQTGVDQAALQIAINFKILHGGWCPKGRLAENGVIPDIYFLKETDSNDVSVRTKHNIRDSDGTLILIPNNNTDITDGTIFTIKEVKEQSKPHLIISLSQDKEDAVESIVEWSQSNDIKILNIAGPRESQAPGIHHLSLIFLEKLIRKLIQTRFKDLKGINKW